MDNQERITNLPLQIKNLQNKFKFKFGNDFDDLFEACIFSLAQTAKDSKYLFFDPNVSPDNQLKCAGTQWRISLMTNDCTQNIEWNSNTKFRLNLEDVFEKEIKVQIQKKELRSDIWSCIGMSTFDAIDLYDEAPLTIKCFSCSNVNEMICSFKIQSFFDIKRYRCCKKDGPNSTDGSVHTLLVSLLNIFYTNEFHDNELLPDALTLMAKIHDNNETMLFSCIRLNKGFDHDLCNTYEMFSDLKEALPKNPLYHGTSKWLFSSVFSNTLSILTLFLVMLNEGFDIHMTYEYYNWNEVIHSYKTTDFDIILPRVSLVSTSNDTTVWNILCNFDFDCVEKSNLEFERWQHQNCKPEKCSIKCSSNKTSHIIRIQNGSYNIDRIANTRCSLNFSSSYQLIDDKKMLLTNEFVCASAAKTPCNTMACNIHELDPSLAFTYAFTILVLIRICHILRIVAALWVYQSTDRMGISNLVAFYLGHCCLKHFEKKSSSILRRIRFFVVIVVIGILMPFATKLFLIIIDVQTYKIEQAYRDKKKLSMLKGVCNRCLDCEDPTCLCIFCGHGADATLSNCKNQLNLCRMRARRSNTTTRCTVAGFQDTFMCILQVYLTIPLIKQYYEPHSVNTDSNEATKPYGVLYLSMFSIITSVLSLSRNLTMSFFEISCKGYLVRCVSARCVYFIYVAIMILTRLLTLSLLGLTYFRSAPNILRNCPYYLAGMVACHILLLWGVGLIQHCSVIGAKKSNLDGKQFTRAHRFLSFHLSITKNSNPEYNQEHRVSYRAIQIILFNAYTALISVFALTRTRSFRTLGGREKLSKISGEVKDTMNYYDRLFFSLIVLVEQVTMFYMIYTSTHDDEFSRGLLYYAIALYVAGKLLHYYFCLSFDPWSLFIPWLNGSRKNCLHKHKRKLIYSIFVMLLTIIIGYMFWSVPNSRWIVSSMIFTIFSVMFFILVPF